MNVKKTKSSKKIVLNFTMSMTVTWNGDGQSQKVIKLDAVTRSVTNHRGEI